jgi:hypothetical protein
MTWLCEQREGDELVFRVGRDGDMLVADFVGVGMLRADTRRSTHSFEPDPRADPVSVAKLVEGPIPALLRHLEGRPALHGAAVALHGRALICVGPSGSGKSTMVAELTMRPPFELVSDDAAALDVVAQAVRITPTEPSLWLLPSARRALRLDATVAAKTRVSPPLRCRSAASVAAICGLTFGETDEPPRLRRLGGSEAFAVLAGCAVRFAIDDVTARTRELDQLVDICKRVPVYELRRPRDLEHLAAAGDLLRALLGEAEAT